MSLLLHSCCAPCLIYPAHWLTKHAIPFSCYFFNPNIHPYKEFRSRLNTFLSFVETLNISYHVERDYALHTFLRMIVFRETSRCSHCYRLRLRKTALCAAMHGYTLFSSTLLYSLHQNHELIRQHGEHVAADGIAFFYHDFREGWQHGIDQSIALEMYRQQYCGCIYSEQERFDNRLKKALKRKGEHHVQRTGSGNNECKQNN